MSCCAPGGEHSNCCVGDTLRENATGGERDLYVWGGGAYTGLEGSGRGVMSTPFSQGRPALRVAILAVNLAVNASWIDACTCERYPHQEYATHSGRVSNSKHACSNFIAENNLNDRIPQMRVGGGGEFSVGGGEFRERVQRRIEAFEPNHFDKGKL